MEGVIIGTHPVLNEVGGRLSTTVVYERNGKRYHGVQWENGITGEKTYYFGGAAHLPNLADIDAAWKKGFPRG